MGLEYGVVGLTCGLRALIRSCCDVVLAGEPVEDCSTANLVAGQVDHLCGVSLGLSRCKLRVPCQTRRRSVNWSFTCGCDHGMIVCRAVSVALFDLCHGVRLA